MRISIQKIKTAEICSKIDDSASSKIIGGARSQFADISLSGSTNNGSAEVNLKARSFGSNPSLQFRTGLNVIETNEGVFSSSSAYVRSSIGGS